MLSKSTVTISPSEIEAFLEEKRKTGRSDGTLEKYRRDLLALYEYLPEDKILTEQALAQWRAWMKEEGCALRTFNSKLSAVNSYLEFKGLRDLQVFSMEKPEDEQPELTRQEYLRLLSTAKTLGKERVYLLVKLLGTTGMPLRDLPQVTVETVEGGGIQLSFGLRQELLAYARRSGITKGPMFIKKSRDPISRNNISDSIRALSKDAKVAPEKANPRCLQKLCRETKANIEREIARLVEQSYEHLLETEQLTIGWDQD